VSILPVDRCRRHQAPKPGWVHWSDRPKWPSH